MCSNHLNSDSNSLGKSNWSFDEELLPEKSKMMSQGVLSRTKEERSLKIGKHSDASMIPSLFLCQMGLCN